ncbi:hypothetical protein EMUCRT_0179 [Ehrlichia cf. muris str. EmCRT]|uniref:Uncharacterized protein n=1 Tax=Ehrlichia cf. muris str. EmCRT TaxID=1359167 RepID=A0A0F3NE07_9RICK|nr:hypothetical protein EMUCRT_0179 [Ehrlichia cf. muris str. EmCRT]
MRADKTISRLVNNRSLALSLEGNLISCIKIANRNTPKYITLAQSAM